ncbi:MAG: ligase-associated DNA damage response endonuclease PdeM [Desulfocapsaceae bacterium]|nr:ligase-associated DNA damage response endonuclease PdeM [Desulfocapsaceae bacterium]
MKTDQHDVVHHCNGQNLLLLPERAIYWQDENALLAADLHLGKEATFRAAGIPLPEGPSSETLVRLTAALQRTGASSLIILGDLFHGDNAIAAISTLMDDWRRLHQGLVIELVAGSHDHWSGQIPEQWQIEVHHSSLVRGPFTLRHYPEAVDNSYCLAGHLHPGVVLKDRSRADAMRLPCFYFGKEFGVLPPFGEFTGLTPLSPFSEDILFVIGDGQVIALPSKQ